MDFKKYNIKTPQQLYDFCCKKLQYGFTYRGKVFTDFEPDFQANMDKYYKLRLGEDLIRSGYGVCWDVCELERDFLISAHIPHECYFLESFVSRDEGGPTHTFALYQENGKWYWFEYTWLYYRGIHEFDTKQQALKDIYNKYVDFYDRKLYDIKLYKTDKVCRRLDTYEFVEHCLGGEKIDISKIK